MYASFKYYEDYDCLSIDELALEFAMRFKFSWKLKAFEKFENPLELIKKYMIYTENHKNWLNACKEILKFILAEKLLYAKYTMEKSINLECDNIDYISEYLEEINDSASRLIGEALVSNISFNLECTQDEECSEMVLKILNISRNLLKIDDKLFENNIRIDIVKEVIPEVLVNCEQFSIKEFIVDLYLMCVASEDNPGEKMLIEIACSVLDRYGILSETLKIEFEKIIKGDIENEKENLDT